MFGEGIVVNANPTVEELSDFRREEVRAPLAYERDFVFEPNLWSRVLDRAYKAFGKQRDHYAKKEIAGRLYGIAPVPELQFPPWHATTKELAYYESRKNGRYLKEERRYRGLKQVSSCLDLPDGNIVPSFAPRRNEQDRALLGLDPKRVPTPDEVKRAGMRHDVVFTRFIRVTSHYSEGYLSNVRLVPKDLKRK